MVVVAKVNGSNVQTSDEFWGFVANVLAEERADREAELGKLSAGASMVLRNMVVEGVLTQTLLALQPAGNA